MQIFSKAHCVSCRTFSSFEEHVIVQYDLCATHDSFVDRTKVLNISYQAFDSFVEDLKVPYILCRTSINFGEYH